MFEALVIIAFLFALWVFGRIVILACSAKDFDWLTVPLGFCVVGLTANALYFTVGLSVHYIQLVFLFALLPCLAIVLRRGIKRGGWIRLLAVCGFFLLLALPACIGGEQYYVFRGNQWDQFNYIDQALTLRDNPYITYQNASANKFLAKDVVVHGLSFLNARPAVGLVFALILPAGQGNIHLLAFLYVTALWTLVFPAACFAWKRILAAYEAGASGPLLLVGPPLAYVVGFWGQYIFDINAWSQMAAMSLLLALVFVYAQLLQRLTDQQMTKGQNLTSNYVLTGLLGAGAFLFYPENAAIHILLLLGSTTLWYIAKRTTPRFMTAVTLGLVFVSAVLLASFPNWKATLGFLFSQIHFGTGKGPDWWKYFDSYWFGLHGHGMFRSVSDLVASSIGLFFVTPDYSSSVPWDIRGIWIVVTVVLALIVLYGLANTLVIQLRANRVTIFFKAVVLAGIPLLIYFLLKGAYWSLGKALSFLSPYIFIALCIPIVERDMTLLIPPTRTRSGVFGNITIRWFAILFVILQIAFGAARIWSSRDPHGIGFDSSTYPSIQGTSLKTEYLWKMDTSAYSGCKGVYIFNDKDPFYMEYMKQKLVYIGVPYFSALPVKTHYAEDKEVGKMPRIYTDCNAVFMKGSSGKWQVENLPQFDGRINLVKRNPMIGFVGISIPEAWGSWTDGATAKILLPQPLPDRFTLELDVVMIFGPNAGKPFRIRAGDQEQTIRIIQPGIYTVTFKGVKNASDLEIFVPVPISPQSLGISNDQRSLGLGLKQLRISPIDSEYLIPNKP